MKHIKRFLVTLGCFVIFSQSTFVLASTVNTLSGWSNTNGPVYLNNVDSIYYNGWNDAGGVKAQMRASYSFTGRRTRVLGYRLMQSEIYSKNKDTGTWIGTFNFTDVIHPYGTLGYTEWFDSPYGVYLDYQYSRLAAGQANRNQIVNDTINYNAGINNTSNNAIIASADNFSSGGTGGFGDAKGASILLRRGVLDADIYLSNSFSVESSLISTLKNRGKKNIFLQGGFATFNNTALFNDGFNVIRIGGKNRQNTLEYSNNMPNGVKSPSMKPANAGTGLIIEGLDSGDRRYSTVVNYLNSLRDSHNMDHLANAFNFLLNNGAIGSIDSVRSWSSPAITIGVNYNGWTTYCSIYGTDPYGIYIYNVVAPGYFENITLVNDAVRVSDYEYNAPGSKDFWVQTNNEFTISANSSLYSNLLPWAYAFNEVYMTDTIDRKIVINNNGSLGYQNGGDWVFSGQTLKSQSKWRSGNRNITENRLGLKANYESDYKVGMYTIFQWGGSIWWGGYGTNNDYVKADGTAPKSDWTPVNYMADANTLNIKQQGIYDSRSGLVATGDNKPWAYVYPEGASSKGGKLYLNKDPSYFDYQNSLNLEGLTQTAGKYGNIVIEFWARDNVGNQGMVSKSIVNRPQPRPTSESVVILDHEYETSSVKWVQANNEFYIDQRGYHSSIYPTQSNIRISATTSYNDTSTSNAYAMTTTAYGTWATNTPNITKNRDTKLSLWDYNGNRYGHGVFYFKANSNLNGKKFWVYGFSEITTSAGTMEGSVVKDPKKLGIDGKPPTINFSNTNNTSTITITDGESGFNRAVVSTGGVTHTYYNSVFNVSSGSDITIVAYDNVGNYTTRVIGPSVGWEGKYIQTWETVVNNKKILKYRAEAEVDNYRYDSNGNVYKSDTSLMFNATVNLYTNAALSIQRTNYLKQAGIIEDNFNQNYGPSLRYEKNNATYSYIRWNHIEDVQDEVDLRLYKDGSPWDSVRKYFSSGRKDYQWTLYQTKDRYGNAITKTKVANGTVTGNEIDVSSYKTGSYEIHVTMYDWNANPSGTTVYTFEHVQPNNKTEVSDLFLKVTAVKDLNWKSMSYPIKYNALEFPLGKNKLSKNGEGIKLGYVINFSIENLVKHSLSDYSATYTMLAENGQELSARSNGVNLKDSDTSSNTGYLSQGKSLIVSKEDPTTESINNGFKSRLFFKHFLPADTEFFTSSNQPYRGKVTIRVKITSKEVGSDSATGVKDYTVDLYTIDTSGTVYDDLIIDKQR